MRSAPVLKLLLAVLLSTAAIAFAQEDEILQRYALAQENLVESRARMLSDPEASMAELQLAFAALRHIALDAGRDDLPPAFNGVVERARQATANRSTPDHQIQTELLRAGLRKALFESALSRWEADPAVARARLEQLLSELGGADIEAALASDASRRTVATAVQALAAAQAAAALAETPEPKPDSRAPTYRVLAVAYGHYLLLQDSQFGDPAVDAGFSAAAGATVEADAERLSEVLGALREGLGRAAEAARRASDEAVPAQGANDSPRATEEPDSSPAVTVAAGATVSDSNPTSESAPGVPAQSATIATVTGTPAEASPQNESRTEAPSALDMPALGPEEGAGDPVERSIATGVENEAIHDRAAGVTATPAGPGSLAVDSEEDATGRLPAEMMVAVANQGATATDTGLASTGATPVDGNGAEPEPDALRAIDDLYASSGRYLLAVQEGRLGDASAWLADFERHYQQAVAPRLSGTDHLLHDRIGSLLGTLRGSPQPRTVDAGALLAQVADVERSLLGERPIARAELVALATGNWSGWTRSLVWGLLALLALLPLYLLNLAFGGGGNRNWRLVGIALLLLLAVPIYEGVRSLLAIAAELSRVSALQILAPYSLVDTPIGQLAWAAMTALAILLASFGLYGICVQFGLIRGRRRPEDSRHTLVTRAATSGGEAVVDWDEEF